MSDQLYMPGFWPDPHDILARSLSEHQPVAAGLMFSGGHDSVCATHLAYEYLKDKLPVFVVHINTSVGIQRTRQYVNEMAEQFEWPLKVYKSPMDYRTFVEQFGFPGPSFHNVVYTRLKERAMRLFIKETKTSTRSRIMLLTGSRVFESKRRMGHAQPVHRDGIQVWTAPIIFWQARQKLDYMAAHGIPHNPVVDLMHMSGECLCGAFARPGELNEWRMWFPDDPAILLIDELQAESAARSKPCRWGERPDAPDSTVKLPMCSHCEAWADLQTVAK